MYSHRIMRGRVGALALLTATVLTATAISTIGADRAESASPAPSTLGTDKSRVVFNSPVRVRGQFRRTTATTAAASGTGAAAPVAPTQPRRFVVGIQFRGLGENHWQTLGRTHAGQAGWFDGRFPVRRSGYFRAVALGGRHTPSRRVIVGSKLADKISKRSAVVGDRVVISGVVRPGGTRPVKVSVGGKTIHTHSDKHGRYSVAWHAPSTGTRSVRISADGNLRGTSVSRKAGKITVFRPAVASWYGPGFYGNRTACGQTLTPGMLGVANKTMPCGTHLTLRYNGNQVQVTVIDRGPYVAGREFDLTEATKNALGFGSTGTVLSSK